MNTAGEQSVYFIIVNWRNTPDTIDCLESIAKIKYTNYKIILVTFIENEKEIESFNAFKNVHMIRIHENLGFAKSANLGISKALSENADYILNLNNDTIVEPDFLKPLITYCETRPRAMVSPAIYLHNTSSIDSFGGKFLMWAGIARLIKKKPNTPPDYLSGACFLCRGECFREVGLFSEDYFLYYEDADWFMRARKLGYQFHIVDECKIWHKSSASSKKKSGWGPVKMYYMARNNYLFADKHFTNLTGFVWKLSYLLIGSTLHILRFCRSVQSLKYHYIGLWHGILKNSGKSSSFP